MADTMQFHELRDFEIPAQPGGHLILPYMHHRSTIRSDHYHTGQVNVCFFEIVHPYFHDPGSSRIQFDHGTETSLALLRDTAHMIGINEKKSPTAHVRGLVDMICES